tara:strand:- start:385 stop:762 length:378 start_codon:yes stop_codon:yes gene_type:complete
MYKLLLILLMCSFSFTEEIDPNVVPCEGTCFSEEEVQNMFNNIKELQFKRETCESAYSNLESQIKDYDKLTMNYEESVRLCEVQIKIKEDMIKTIKPKWYENKYLWFFGGVFFTSSTVYLAGQIK